MGFISMTEERGMCSRLDRQSVVDTGLNQEVGGPCQYWTFRRSLLGC